MLHRCHDCTAPVTYPVQLEIRNNSPVRDVPVPETRLAMFCSHCAHDRLRNVEALGRLLDRTGYAFSCEYRDGAWWASAQPRRRERGVHRGLTVNDADIGQAIWRLVDWLQEQGRKAA